jgi:hypothetical protein
LLKNVIEHEVLSEIFGPKKEVAEWWRKLHYDDDVDRVRLRLWTAAFNESILHPPGDIWAWRTMVELYREGNFLFVPQSSLVILLAVIW